MMDMNGPTGIQKTDYETVEDDVVNDFIHTYYT